MLNGVFLLTFFYVFFFFSRLFAGGGTSTARVGADLFARSSLLVTAGRSSVCVEDCEVLLTGFVEASSEGSAFKLRTRSRVNRKVSYCA